MSGHAKTLLLASVLIGSLRAGEAWAQSIETPYYVQVVRDYCGPASAQMILNSRSLEIWISPQRYLYDHISSHNACPEGWATDPAGLSSVLNHHVAAHPSAISFESVQASQDTANKSLLGSLLTAGVPAAALINGCIHWVVVRGVVVSQSPTTEERLTMHAVRVHDPWFGYDSLGQDRSIHASSWNEEYFSRCSWCVSPGRKHYLVVGAERAVLDLEIEYPPVAERREELIGRREIVRIAQEVLLRLSQPLFQPVVGESQKALAAGQPGQPHLVRRTDRERDAYYIVPFDRGPKTVGAMLLNAYSGQFMELSHVADPIRYTPVFSREFARELFFRRFPTVRVRPEVLDALARSMEGRASGRPEFRDEVDLEREQGPSEREGSVPRRTPEAETRQWWSPEGSRLPPAATPTFDRLGIGLSSIEIKEMILIWQPWLEAQSPYYPVWAISGEIAGVQGSHLLGYVTTEGYVLSVLTPASDAAMKGGAAH